MSDKDVPCVLVHYPDGTEAWEPLADYLTNPPLGTFIIRDSRKVRVNPGEGK